MSKTEVYSWRLSRETKIILAREARREGVTMAALLDRMAREWIAARNGSAGSDAAEQARLHAAAAQTFGTLAGGNPRRAETARAAIRERLAQRYGRRRTH